MTATASPADSTHAGMSPRAAMGGAEAESHDELSELLMRIPLHSISDVEVVPLASHESVIPVIRKSIERLKSYA